MRRKEKLRTLVPLAGSPILYTSHLDGKGCELFRVACEADLEGIVAKRKDAPYECGERVTTWAKIKNPHYSQARGGMSFSRAVSELGAAAQGTSPLLPHLQRQSERSRSRATTTSTIGLARAINRQCPIGVVVYQNAYLGTLPPSTCPYSRLLAQVKAFRVSESPSNSFLKAGSTSRSMFPNTPSSSP